MDAFLVSTLAVTVGEIGDKTQLLAFLLAARYKKSLPIVAGILVATLLNHALAGLFGQWIVSQIAPHFLRWALGISFIFIALWTLKPDEFGEDELSASKLNVFWVTCITFFLAEIGDKTQIATVALAANYNDLFAVVAGTTLGMMIADVPAVYFGQWATPKFPFKLIRYLAASIFAIIGVLVLFN
jgi:putative Ca2+/H+ antiporter (TMEM165/GDT1 family)